MTIMLRRGLALATLFSLAACGAPVAGNDAAQPDALAEASASDVASDSASALDDASVLDAAASDASSLDARSADGSGGALDAQPDATALDARADAATDGGTDAASDARADSGVFVPPPSCMYVNVNDLVVQCAGRPRLVNNFNVVPPDPMCPAYWQVGSAPPATTAEQAALNAGCTTACVWRFATSVSRIYCGMRSGYDILEGTPATCPRLYNFPEGYFSSVEEHDAMFPCRDR